ncbi:MAG: type II toxin-antitoxin system VapC family toxin [Bacteroidota bacterium]
MEHFVIDTSVIVKAFSEGPEKARAEQLIKEVLLKKIQLFAPNLLWYEFYGVMIKTYGKDGNKAKIEGCLKGLNLVGKPSSKSYFGA